MSDSVQLARRASSASHDGPFDLDEARVRDLDALALEEPLAEGVGGGRAVEGGVDVDRVPGSRRVQLGERRQPVLAELARHQAADRRNERALRHALGAFTDYVLRFSNGERRFDGACLVAGTAAHQLHVESGCRSSRG